MGPTTNILLESLRQLWSGFVAGVPRVLAGLVVLFLFLLASRALAAAIRGGAAKARLHSNLSQLLGRLARFAGTVLGIFVAAVVVFPAFKLGDLVAGLGITSIAIGFAFKDILQNFFAGILILWRQPFQVGDEIKSGEYEGTVEEINSRSTRIKTYDGERAVVPNADIYTSTVLVRTAYPSRRARLVVGIGYKDSIEEGQRVIRGVLESTDGVLQEPEPWIHVTELAPSSVNLTVYFWVHPKQSNLLKVRADVARRIKEALDGANIDMPYPHTVVLLENSGAAAP